MRRVCIGETSYHNGPCNKERTDQQRAFDADPPESWLLAVTLRVRGQRAVSVKRSA